MFFGFLIAGNQPTTETGFTSSSQQNTDEDTRATIDLRTDEIVTLPINK